MDDREKLEKELAEKVEKQRHEDHLTPSEEKGLEYAQGFVWTVMQMNKDFDKKLTSLKLESKLKTKKTNLTEAEWLGIVEEINSRVEVRSEKEILDVLISHMKTHFELDPVHYAQMYPVFRDKTLKEFIKLIRPQAKKKEPIDSNYDYYPPGSFNSTTIPKVDTSKVKRTQDFEGR